MEISMEQIEALSQKLSQSVATGKKDDLSIADIMQISSVFDCWKQIAHRLQDGKMSIKLLRDLFQLVTFAQAQAVEGERHEIPDLDSDEPQLPTNRGPHGKRGEDRFPNAEVVCHHHKTLKPGDFCPQCDKGRLHVHKQDEGKIRTLIRITGHAPLSATIHKFYDLRCNLCKEIYKVEAPPEITSNGHETQRFSNDAIAMIAVQKYLGGTPWFRQSELQYYLGTDISSTSMWDQCETLADVIKPIYSILPFIASQAKLFYTDDTRALILNKKSARILRRGTDKAKEREGCHSSCLIAETDDNKKLVLIKTDIIHAGEWIDEILRHRFQSLPPPLHMADRASCNSATVRSTVEIACNQHARANFVEIEEKFKLPCGKVLSIFRKVFRNDQMTQTMSAPERLAFHQEKSRPLMDELFLQAEFALTRNFTAEPNSPLGKAYKYLLNHRQELLGFTLFEGAPLSNNLCERMIKKIVLLRKNSWFYRSTTGARVSDIILSLGLTTILMDGNPFHYFKTLLSNRQKVKESPHSFMPWNYQAISI